MQRKVSVLWGEKKAVLHQTLRAMAPFGGLSVFIEFLKRIGFRRQVRRNMPVCWKSNNAIPAAETFTAFLIAVAADRDKCHWANLWEPLNHDGN